MKGGTLQMNWHQTMPVLTLDFHPQSGLLATGGSDHDIKLWLINPCGQKDIPTVSYQNSLSFHGSAVNVLRFSPFGDQLASGADGGELIIWKLHSSDICQTWKVLKTLSFHRKDVLDIQWSTDGAFLISGSVDNSCIIWDINKGSVHQILEGHLHYVQGVAWDPLGQYVASLSSDRTCLSSDRTCRIYLNKPQNKPNNPNVMNFVLQNVIMKTELLASDPKIAPTKSYLFHDETLPSFFRRLAWSPDGSVLLTPAGSCKFSPTSDTINTSYIFSRKDLSRPTIYLPAAAKPVIAVRFCPVVFRRRGSTPDEVFKLPYRLVFAVASLNSLCIYDTENVSPIAVLSRLHYKAVTDVAWSPDAKYLALSSQDGYCTLLEFGSGELGTPIPICSIPIPGIAKQKITERRHPSQDRILAARARDEVATSFAGSQPEAIQLEKKRPTSSYQKVLKVENPSPKRQQTKHPNMTKEVKGEHGDVTQVSRSPFGNESTPNEVSVQESADTSGPATSSGGDAGASSSRLGTSSAPAVCTLPTSFPGGPSDLSLLTSFENHVLVDIWNNKPRGLLRCLNHGMQITFWESIARHPHRETIYKLIYESGLGPLGYISYHNCNQIHVSGIIERWQPETNTFHLPFGEMTITLDDVQVLLGIPVTGKTLVAKTKDCAEVIAMTSRLLGVTVQAAQDEISRWTGQKVSLMWLKEQFSTPIRGKKRADGTRNDDLFPSPDCLVRAYILYLLGATIFTDESGKSVPLSLLQLLENVEEIGSFGWGGAALANLYRQLGVASRVGVNQIVGYMTLLEGWLYDRIPFIEPTPRSDYTPNMPRVMKWHHKEWRLNDDSLPMFRVRLDNLRAHEVNWDNTTRGLPLVHEIAFYNKSMRYLDVVEPHNPDRVLRQMGYVQGKPRDPYRPLDAYRSKLGPSYTVKYSFDPQFWEDWEDNLLSNTQRGQRAEYPCQSTEDYLEWFQSVSHPFACNPEFPVPIVHKDEATLRSRQALNVALQFRSMPKKYVTSDNAFKMADQVIALLSGVADPTGPSTTPSQSEAPTTSTATL